MTDQQYIDIIRSKNERQFTPCYDRYRSRFVGYFMKCYGKDLSYVVDLYQDAFVVLWEKATDENFTLKSSLSTFLIGIGKMLMMSRDRKYRSMISYEDCLAQQWCDDLNSLADILERDRLIEQVVAKMTEPCNTLLHKFYWDDQSTEQIAQDLGYKNTDTVKTQKYKCMQKLKMVLQDKISSIL